MVVPLDFLNNTGKIITLPELFAQKQVKSQNVFYKENATCAWNI